MFLSRAMPSTMRMSSWFISFAFLSLLSCPRYSLAHTFVSHCPNRSNKKATFPKGGPLFRTEPVSFRVHQTREPLIRAPPGERQHPRQFARGSLRGWSHAYARAWADSSFVPAATVPRL